MARLWPKEEISSCMRQPVADEESRCEQLAICPSYTFIHSLCVYVPRCACAGRKTTSVNWFSPTITCVQGSNSQVLGLAASAISHLSHPSPRNYFSSVENKENVSIKGKLCALVLSMTEILFSPLPPPTSGSLLWIILILSQWSLHILFNKFQVILNTKLVLLTKDCY